MTGCSIAVLLPSREGFDPCHFGAIALCVRDFIEHSRYRAAIRVYGGVSDKGFAGIHYQRLFLRQRWLQSRSAAYAVAFSNELRAQKPKLVEIHNRPNLVLAVAKYWHGPIALHLHNDPQEMKFARTSAQRQKLLARCAAIYCVSDYIRQRFLEGLEDSSKVQTVYNGFTLKPTTRIKQKQITFVGRLKPEKGALEFVEGLLPVLQQYPDWKGVMIGASRHQPDAKITDYEQRIHTLLRAQEDRIEMRGFCNHEETIATLEESAIAVVPSCWNEAFGRTALEAMACGCATVSSTRGGLEEVIGDAAYRLETVNGPTIAAALHTLIESEALREDFQRRALEQAKRFDIARCTAELDALRATCIS